MFTLNHYQRELQISPSPHTRSFQMLFENFGKPVKGKLGISPKAIASYLYATDIWDVTGLEVVVQ